MPKFMRSNGVTNRRRWPGGSLFGPRPGSVASDADFVVAETLTTPSTLKSLR